MKIWFMFSNHTFARLEPSSSKALITVARNLFKRDTYGSLFVRDEFDTTIRYLDLDGHGDKKGVSVVDLEAWADKVMAEVSFRKIMY